METGNGSVDAISKQLHVSKSTVSKALNNCAAVDDQTKKAILQTASELHYTPAQKKRVGRISGVRKVGVVMPINPYYFWNEAIRGMKAAQQKHDDFQVVFSLFANLYSEHDALYCLDYMSDLQIDLLVVTPPFFTSVWNRLSDTAAHIPVVCFNETAEIPFLFYAGANFYRDGVLLARACADSLRSHPGILKISGGQLPMVSERDDGFRREIASLVPEAKWVGDIDISGLSSPVSAQLARIIHEKYTSTFRSVYVSQGFLPQVCLTLQKLKLLRETAVFGYENPEQNAFYTRSGTIAAYLEQDTYAQGYRCMEEIDVYLTEGRLPDNRCVFVPSRLHGHQPEGAGL